MTNQQITDGYHLSLSIGKSLWDDLVGSALPVKVAEGSFDLGRMVYQGVKQLGVKERVVALLEDREGSGVVTRARGRAVDLWRDNREQILEVLNGLLQVEGDWQVEIDEEGSEFRYGEQKIGVDAHAKVSANGKAYLAGRNVELPFTLEKRIGASCSLANIHFDKDSNAVVGEVTEPSIDFGENVVLQLLNRLGEMVLDKQVGRFGKVPILKKEQLDSMVAPAGGPLKLQMGVEDVALDVTETDLTLRIRFGFTPLPQIAAT
ncbi:MAG: hypothetical protein QGG40_02580 [Myxococcota bacterium]|nr:hypothetical protein [Myxococcota bacterium]